MVHERLSRFGSYTKAKMKPLEGLKGEVNSHDRFVVMIASSYSRCLPTPHRCSCCSQLYKDMLDHLKQTDQQYPYPDGAFLYYSRTEV